MAVQVPENYDGSTPHPDMRREGFAKDVAMGRSYLDSYSHIARDTSVKYTSRKSSAFKIAKEWAVAKRIIWWRLELQSRIEVPDQLDGVMLRGLFEESVLAINTAIEVGEKNGALSPLDTAKLTQLVTRIVGRMSRSTEPDKSPPPPKLEIDETVIDFCNCAPQSATRTAELV